MKHNKFCKTKLATSLSLILSATAVSLLSLVHVAETSEAEVYKTGRANVASGGIGATIDIRTARPFDAKGKGLLPQ